MGDALKKILLFFLVVGILAAAILRFRYGGGVEYPDLTDTALRDAADVEVVFTYPEPIGNIAVNAEGRVFFTVHPESRPEGNKLLEIVDGAAVPYPDSQSQSLFDTVLGVVIDSNNRLWTIDHGNHGLRTPRLIGIDLSTGEVIRNHPFDKPIAPLGSFLQDLQVTRDGESIVIADASFWKKAPALIVYDVESGSARRVLEAHDSLSAEPFIITSEGRRMQFLGSLLSLRGGVDGIAVTERWLYYGALNGSSLYRVRLDDLLDARLPNMQLAARIERVAEKPLSDGMSADLEGRVYLTDVEHNALFVVDEEQTLKTYVRDPRIRWPDALSFGPDNFLYIADSALSEVVFRDKAHIESQRPYGIFRIQAENPGVPGQ